MYTQYMFNAMAINPAYAGSHDIMTTNFLMREQWVGLDGAPASQTFSIHSPFNRSGSANFGGLFIRDKIGVTDQVSGYLAFAYRIKFSGSHRLAFGVQGGLANYRANFTQINNTDPVFDEDINITRPNFGAGIYYHSDRAFAGISVPQLIETSLDVNNNDSDSRLVRHYFGYFGYVFDLNKDLKLKPSMLLKYTNSTPFQFDINANLLIRELIWVGLSYRSLESIDALFSINISKKFQFGYSYDFATSKELQRVNSGTHELMLQYKIFTGKRKVVSPRYF